MRFLRSYPSSSSSQGSKVGENECSESYANTSRSLRQRRRRMFGFHGYLSTFIIFTLASLTFPSPGDGIQINSHGGYEDIVVSISSEVPPIICQQLVQNLQTLLTSTSVKLYTATRERSYFHRITIVLPSSFDARACGSVVPTTKTSLSSTSTAEFIIGAKHPVYGIEPFTQQSEGCGNKGDYIQVPYKFINQRNLTTTPSPELILLQQWTKFRYGVFDEKGFDRDPIYPVVYHDGDEKGGDESKKGRVTSCSDKPLKGIWVPNNDTSWQSHSTFIPSEDNDAASSIMSIPHNNLKYFCDSRSHNGIAPTKQNFLCSGKSVEEVVLRHADFQGTYDSHRGHSPDTIFEIKQITPPKFVLLFEETNSMNLRDVWKYLKLAIRKFIKYDLQTGTQIGLMTIGNDVRILANMTILDEHNLRGALAEKLPNYPNIESQQSGGGFSLLKGISNAINMLKKSTSTPVAGSVIILISQGTTTQNDLESSLHFLKQAEISIATIEYPSVGDGKISFLSKSTNSPHYSIRETGVGTMSHMSTYIQLVNSLLDIQRFYTKGIAAKWPTLIHQEEFKGDAPSFVASSFSFDISQGPGSFYIYVPNPIDPKVNTVKLTSPSGIEYTDQLSYLHDINVIKIDAQIDQSGIWTYRIQRLGDSHQSHFVQVLASGGNTEDLSVRVYSNVDATRIVNLLAKPLILYAEVKRGNSPVIGADVVALVNGNWSINLLDNGNGDPDLTSRDGVYSRYILPSVSSRTAYLDITVKVTTSPYRARYIVSDSNDNLIPACCGSQIVVKSPSTLRTLGYNERVVYSYAVKVMNARDPGTYPPSRVGDLKISKTFETQVTLQFTSPGDDYDQGLPAKYIVTYSEKRKLVPLKKSEFLNTSQGGATVNLTVDLQSYKLWFLAVSAVDRMGGEGDLSNIVEVRLKETPDDGFPHGVGPAGNSGLQSGGSLNEDGDPGLTKTELILIGAGSVLLLLIIILLAVCIYCRRRSTKTMGSTDTKISTISDTKAPIHWSASELLQEHEKRQSIYHSGQYYGRQPPHDGTSPTSSFRSIIDNRRTSLDSNRRATATDYDSCNSDKTLKSLKGQTDYDTCTESDDIRGMPYHVYPPPYNGREAGGYPQYFMNQQQLHSTQLHYNPNIQGSLNSVNSKKRNITMV